MVFVDDGGALYQLYAVGLQGADVPLQQLVEAPAPPPRQLPVGKGDVVKVDLFPVQKGVCEGAGHRLAVPAQGGVRQLGAGDSGNKQLFIGLDIPLVLLDGSQAVLGPHRLWQLLRRADNKGQGQAAFVRRLLRLPAPQGPENLLGD